MGREAADPTNQRSRSTFRACLLSQWAATGAAPARWGAREAVLARLKGDQSASSGRFPSRGERKKESESESKGLNRNPLTL